MHEVKAVIRPELVETVIQALQGVEAMPGLIVSTVRGHGRRSAGAQSATVFDDVPMAKIEVVVGDELLSAVVDVIRTHAHTGRDGDGRIFVSAVGLVVAIRSTGSERGQ